MSVTVSNILQQVQTYQMASLAFLDNEYCFYNLTNKKFKDFQNLNGNLGQTVTFELPPRFSSIQSLILAQQPIQQRVLPLSVDTPWSSSVTYTAQEFIYNVEEYMKRVGMGLVWELGSKIESWLALNAVSGVPVLSNQVPTGALHTESGPYRFYGDGVTPITSYQQLAKALTYFRNYGAASNVKGIISDISYPDIVGTGLNQFVNNRNEEIAMSWKLGEFSQCQWHQSNLLPIHVSGNASNTVLTVVSTNDPTGVNITQITFSGATASDANAIFSGDLGQFQDGVAGQPNLRYLTFVGHSPSSNKVQIRATSNVGADSSGNVIVNITPGLCSQSGNQNQNITSNIVAGMQFKFMPSHKGGLLYGGDAFYMGMPVLPDQSPFVTSRQADPETGAGFRMTFGSILGQNQSILAYDAITGSVLVPEYSMRILLPLTQ